MLWGGMLTGQKQLISKEINFADRASTSNLNSAALMGPGCIPCIQHAEVVPRQNLSMPHSLIKQINCKICRQ